MAKGWFGSFMAEVSHEWLGAWFGRNFEPHPARQHDPEPGKGDPGESFDFYGYAIAPDPGPFPGGGWDYSVPPPGYLRELHDWLHQEPATDPAEREHDPHAPDRGIDLDR